MNTETKNTGILSGEQISFISVEEKDKAKMNTNYNFEKEMQDEHNDVMTFLVNEQTSKYGQQTAAQVARIVKNFEEYPEFYKWFSDVSNVEGNPQADEQLKEFFTKLTPGTFKAAEVDAAKFTIMQARLSTPDVADILKIFSIGELNRLFYAGKPQKKSLKQQARETGAIVDIAENIPTITNPHYRNAFTTKPNKYAYVVKDVKNLIASLEQNDESGSFTAAPFYDTERRQNFDDAVKKSAADPNNVIDPAIIGAIIAACKMARFDANGEEIPQTPESVKVYLPTFYKYLNVRKENVSFTESGEPVPTEENQDNKTGNNWNEFLKLEDYFSVFDGGSEIVKLLTAVSFNQKTQILELIPTGIIKTFFKAAEDEKNTYKIGTKELKRPYFHELETIEWQKIRDKKAAEIAHNILIEVATRGTTPDAELKHNKNLKLRDKTTITVKIKYNDIIKYCPKLQQELKETKTANVNKNVLLRRHFKKAYEILNDPKYCNLTRQYLGVAFDEYTTPTTTTLNNYFILTHKGKAN